MVQEVFNRFVQMFKSNDCCQRNCALPYWLTCILILISIKFTYAQTVVGTIDGTFAPSPSGAAMYSIPIELKNGVSTFTPQISLVYNSQAGNGLLGTGWNISGLSSITSINHNRHFDGNNIQGVSYDNTDAYALDGQRLLLVSGENGELNAQYVLEEDNYSEISVLGASTYSPDSFIVRLPNGVNCKYGTTNDSRVTIYNRTHNAITKYAWNISYSEDGYGNYIKYEYNDFSSIPYISKIIYGQNKNNSRTDYCSIDFEYESRDDVIKAYSYGQCYTINVRLKRIKCYYFNTTSPYMQYVLDYDDSNSYSHLTSIREIGTDNVSSLPATTFVWNESPSNLFPFYSTVNSVAGFSQSDYNNGNQYYTPADIDNDGITELIRVDNAKKNFTPSFNILKLTNNRFNSIHNYQSNNLSGYSEVTNGRCFISHISETQSNTLISPRLVKNSSHNYDFYLEFPEHGGYSWHRQLLYSEIMPTYATGDFNKDGLDEVVYLERMKLDQQKFYVNICNFDVSHQSNSFTPIEISALGLSTTRDRVTGRAQTDNKICNCAVSDFDGDGLIDILAICEDFSIMLWNNNGSFDSYHFSVITDIRRGALFQLTDINGDGLIDIAINETSSSSWKVFLNKGSKNSYNFMSYATISLPVQFQTIAQSDEEIDPNMFGITTDFNGDGKSDFILGDPLGHVVWIKSVPYQGDITYQVTDTYQHMSPYIGTKHIYYGDFDGDGIVELMNCGGNLHANLSSSNQTRAWNIYKNSNGFDANTIQKITDGLGKETSVIYQLNKYTDSPATSNLEYPLMKFTVPICAVSEVTESSGTSSYTSYYSYSGGIGHQLGLGFLGYTCITTESEGLISIQQSQIYNSDGIYVNCPESLEIYGSNDELKSSSTYEYVFDISANKSFHKNLSEETLIDNSTYQDITTQYSDFEYGVPKTIVSEHDGLIITTTQTLRNTTSDGHIYRALPLLSTTEKRADIYATPDATSTTPDYFYEQIKYTYRGRNEIQTKTYYSSKNLASLTNYRVRKFGYFYDLFGNVTSEHEYLYSNNLSLITKYTYDDHGLLLTKKDPKGQIISYSYDNFGRAIQEHDDQFNITNSFQYDVFGRLVGRTKSSDNNLFTSEATQISMIGTQDEGSKYCITTSISNQPTEIKYYDGFGRNVADGLIHFDGREYVTNRHYLNRTLIDFESLPHLKGISTTDGTTYTYDNLLRLQTIIDPMGKTTTYTYQDPLWYSKTVEENGLLTYYEYDGDGKLLVQSLVDGDNEMWAFYIYKASGDYHYIDINYGDDTWLTTTFTYDGYGRVSSITDADGSIHQYTYDTSGNIASEKLNNETTTYTYNRYNELTTKNYKAQDSSVSTTYTYTNHLLTKVQGPSDKKTFTYNSAGQLVSETKEVTALNCNHSITTTYAYLGESKISDMYISISGVNVPLTESHSYNQYGWMDKVKFNDTIVWQLSSEDTYGHPSVIGNYRHQVTSVFNKNGQLVRSRIMGNNQSILKEHNYSYNANGFLINKDGYQYSYDDFNRLTSWNNNEYSYDNKSNIVVDGGQTDIEYNNYQIHHVDNPNVNVWGNSAQDYILNGNRQPYRITQPNGYSEFNYDSDWNRISMARYSYLDTVSAAPGTPSNEVMDYLRVYCGDRYEVNVSSDDSTAHIYYIAGNPLTASAYARIINNQVKLFLLYRDNQGSITEISDGNTIKSYYYDPWGRPCNSSGSPLSVGTQVFNDYYFCRGYLGQEYLQEYGLINLNARLYNPFIGRFLTPDPVLNTTGSLFDFNPYVYGKNCPTYYVDPDGKFPFILIPIVAGGLINLYSNWDHVHNFWQGVGFFAVGAGTSTIAAISGVGAVGILPGLLSGALSGSLMGPITASLNAAVGGYDLSAEECISSAITGGLLGGVFGGVSGYFNAVKSNCNWWSGAKKPTPNPIKPSAIPADVETSAPKDIYNSQKTIYTEKPIGYDDMSPYHKGEWGKQYVVKELESQGNTVVGTEVSTNIDGVRTKMDIISIDKDGHMIFTEVKTGPTARFTPNQTINYPKMMNGEAVIPTGKNALVLKMNLSKYGYSSNINWNVHSPFDNYKMEIIHIDFPLSK